MKKLSIIAFISLYSSILLANQGNECQIIANNLADTLTTNFQKIVKGNSSSELELENKNMLKGLKFDGDHMSCDGVQNTCLAGPGASIGDVSVLDAYNFLYGNDRFSKIENFEVYSVDIESRQGQSEDYWERGQFLLFIERSEFQGVVSCLVKGVHKVHQLNEYVSSYQKKMKQLETKAKQLDALRSKLDAAAQILKQ